MVKCLLQGAGLRGKAWEPRQAARLPQEGTGRGACGCRLESSWPHISEWDGSRLRSCRFRGSRASVCKPT